MRPERDRSAPRKPILARGADGSLKSASDTDIGDIWAQQERIRLAKQIEEDKAKAERKEKRGHRFKRRPREAEPTATPVVVSPKVQESPQKTPLQAKDNSAAAAKTIEINLNLPSARFFKSSWTKLKRLPGAIFSYFKGLKRSVSISAASILGILLILLAFNIVFRHHSSPEAKSSDSSSNSGGNAVTLKATPTFNTISPSTKSIQELGGWARVSPKGSDPAFAYVDTVKGVKIIVSEQLLPKSFQAEPATSIANLAEQFSARQKIQTGDTTVYYGNSTKGVQSLVFAKDGLLMLIKADSQLSENDWIEYIDSLE